MRDGAGDTAQLGFRLRLCDALAQASEHTHRNSPAASARIHRIGMLQRIRDVDINRFRNTQRRIIEMEPGRQHADHQRGLPIQAKSPSDGVRVGA